MLEMACGSLFRPALPQQGCVYQKATASKDANAMGPTPRVPVFKKHILLGFAVSCHISLILTLIRILNGGACVYQTPKQIEKDKRLPSNAETWYSQ